MSSKLVKVVLPTGEIVHVPHGSSVFVNGEQVCDPTPVEMPIGYERPESLESMLIRLVHQVSQGQAEIGEETLDDANDFEVDDEELLEDTFTDRELDAIMATPEMREQVIKEGGRVLAEPDSRDTGGEEEDDEFSRESADRRDYERFRDSERSGAGSARRGEESADRGEELRREPPPRTKDVRKGTERKKR